MMTAVDVVAIVITIIGLVAALIARKTWLIVEGDLAESWRWLLPSVPIYAISFLILIVHNYMERFAVKEPVFSTKFMVDIAHPSMVFNLRVWEPIVLVQKNIQVLSEFLFLVLVLIGLIRQYKLFRELYDKQN
jgi:hypothetical protein